MKWSVQQLNTLKIKGIKLDEMVDVSDIKNMNKDIREISEVHVKGDASFTAHSVSFTLELSGELVLPCSRTLKDVLFPFQIQTTETFKLHEWIGFEGDEEVHDVENDVVDLMPYMKQAILLEIPIQIFCEDVEKEAAPSGQDWEFLTEESKKERIDPRLAGLAKFFEDK